MATEREADWVRGSAVFVWSDRALFLGDRSETAEHAHNAIEICIALDERGIEMADSAIALEAVAGAVVRAGAPHRLSIPGPKVAVLYIDPHSPVGTGLHTWLDERSLAPLPSGNVVRHRPALIELLTNAETDAEDASAAIAAIVDELAKEPAKPAIDSRIRRAMEFIGERLMDPPSLADLAKELGMSASWLGHEFSRQVGLPTRRYVLWLRLRAALVGALEGTTMTDAAHAAGFSDAAHFTRTCQKMFGLPPTAFAPVDAVFVVEPA